MAGGGEVPPTSRAQGVFEELRGNRGPIPLRSEDPVFAGLLSLKRLPHTREGHGPGSDRDRLEARLRTRSRRLAKSLGMTVVSVHTLRHSCASRMVGSGVPLSFVARVPIRRAMDPASSRRWPNVIRAPVARH